MIAKPASCHGCALEKLSTGFMQVDGKGASGVAIVAEALGKEEAKKGVALIGPSGWYTQKAIERVGLNLREDFWLLNCVWCQPPDNKLVGMPYEKKALHHCHPNLVQAIEELKPKALLAFGETAFQQLTGMRGIMDCRGYPQWSDEFQLWVVPTLHPSFMLHGNHKWQPVFRWDVQKAVQIAKEGFEYDVLDPVQDPSPYGFGQWVHTCLSAGPTAPIAVDIETPGKRGRDEDELDEGDPSFVVLRVGFAYGESSSQAVSVPWRPEYMAGIRELLGSNRVKLFWNAGYDVPRIEAAGLTINGHIRDSQVAWHVLNSDLRKKLGTVASLCPEMHRFPMWKHLSQQQPAYYNALDTLANWILDRWILRRLKETGRLWEVFEEQIEQVTPVLRRMSQAGMLFDQKAAQELSNHADRLMVDILQQMQEAVPDSCKPKKVYKKKRDGLLESSLIVEVRKCPTCGKLKINKKHPCLKVEGVKPELVSVTVPVWEQVLPFVPSPPQLLSYALLKSYPLSKDHKTHRVTMDDQAITKIRAKFPDDVVFALTPRYREYQKANSTYIKGPRVGEDGRVHGVFRDTPSTLRLAMQAPNLQNIPRADEEAGEDDFYAKIRSLYIASPSMVLGARDYSGIEAVLVGYLAQDPNYIRLATMGVHSYLCSHIVGEPADLSASDSDLRAYLKGMKKRAEYLPSKKTVHLSNYLGTPSKMLEAEPEVFKTLANAEKFQRIYFEAAPCLPAWHLNTCMQVDKLGYLEMPDGFVHRYWSIFRWRWDEGKKEWTFYNKDGTVAWGEDAKRCIACGPQHMAAVMIKAALVVLGKDERVAPFLRLTIHDEILWECPKAKYEEVDAIVAEVMERPCKHLPMPVEWGLGEYLSIKTEGKKGERWGQMR